MRAFSLFVSALALANLSQATPLDYELAQLDAELELEAELPIDAATGQKVVGWVKRFIDLAKNGNSFKSES